MFMYIEIRYVGLMRNEEVVWKKMKFLIRKEHTGEEWAGVEDGDCSPIAWYRRDGVNEDWNISPDIIDNEKSYC